jgi:hypothetical protein
MRPLLSTGISLAFLTAIGIGACTDAGNDTTTTSNPPATEEPAQTGSLPAEEPVAPAEEPAPATPPAEEGTTQ